MQMEEIVSQVAFSLGIPANENVENLDIQQAALIAFRELSRYIRDTVDVTVPYSTRMNLADLNIDTDSVVYVRPANPRLGLTLGSIESGNVFQVAASVNSYSTTGYANMVNIDPIMKEVGLSQVRNSLSSNLQWRHDVYNNVLYCTHQQPRPTHVTIRYVPKLHDVSEIVNPTWIDYLIRLTEAHMKKALGRSRSKYRIEGSNVSLDGEQLLSEANAELEAIREELKTKPNRLVIIN